MTKNEYVSAPQTKAVKLPELGKGKTGYVKVMNSQERFDWLRLAFTDEENGPKNMFALLVRCICDKDGKRVFTDSDDDLAIVSNMDGRAGPAAQFCRVDP